MSHSLAQENGPGKYAAISPVHAHNVGGLSGHLEAGTTVSTKERKKYVMRTPVSNTNWFVRQGEDGCNAPLDIQYNVIIGRQRRVLRVRMHQFVAFLWLRRLIKNRMRS